MEVYLQVFLNRGVSESGLSAIRLNLLGGREPPYQPNGRVNEPETQFRRRVEEKHPGLYWKSNRSDVKHLTCHCMNWSRSAL
jgi:hypothetical protein